MQKEAQAIKHLYQHEKLQFNLNNPQKQHTTIWQYFNLKLDFGALNLSYSVTFDTVNYKFLFEIHKKNKKNLKK